jgi:hypothetical protein
VRAVSEAWREQGIETTSVRGPDDPKAEADVLLLHVDLTVVPEEYLAQVGRYEIALNGRVRDVSKRAIAPELAVTPGDRWAGPVIVKTDRNCGGQMEDWAVASAGGRVARLARHLRRLVPARLGGPLDPLSYPIYPSAEHVPGWVWQDPRLVVQRFLPERRDGLTCLRCWIFLGDCELNLIAFSEGPIVKARTTRRRENLGPPPAELRAARERLGFDYGKFDYGIVGGELVLYDVNQAPTYAASMAAAERRRIGALLAAGLRSFAGQAGAGA